MKLTVDSGERYPALFIREPVDDYERGRAFDVPDEMYERLSAAYEQADAAEQEILRHLLATGQVRPGSDLIEDHLDQEEGRAT